MSVPAKDTVPLANALKYGGLESASQYGTAYSNRNDREVLNSCEHIAENGHGTDPRFTFLSKLPLPSESDYLWPLSGLPQYDPPPSSMLKVSSTSSSLLLNSQSEPPSNQISHGNYAPIQQEEEKMSGLKRTPPFSSEKLPVFSVHLKLLTSANTLQRSDETASSDYGTELIYEPGTGSFRTFYFGIGMAKYQEQAANLLLEPSLLVNLPIMRYHAVRVVSKIQNFKSDRGGRISEGITTTTASSPRQRCILMEELQA